MSVPPGEKLARFIFSKKHFSVENKEVKFKAFTPLQIVKISPYIVSRGFQTVKYGNWSGVYRTKR